MFDVTVRESVAQLARPDTRWLSTGYDGGFERASAAYNVTVPEDWTREDLGEYSRERRAEAEFERDGPTLLTGVSMAHLRGARLGPVCAYATVGVSNPATLPLEAVGTHQRTEMPDRAGTVNIVVGTTRSLTDGAQANLVSVVTEAKTATLLELAGATGTTTDAVVVGSATDGERTQFTGSATEVGAAARACVREALRASFEARYSDENPPEGVADARHGVVTDQHATTFNPHHD